MTSVSGDNPNKIYDASQSAPVGGDVEVSETGVTNSTMDTVQTSGVKASVLLKAPPHQAANL